MFQVTDGRTGVKYHTTDRVPGTPPIAFGWTIHWNQMARFLELPESDAICGLKDDELHYDKVYFKSDLYCVVVINGYEKDHSDRIIGHLRRTKTGQHLEKFKFYPGRGMSSALLEAFYPNVAQRARLKLESELMPVTEKGVKPWFFIGHASHELYCVNDKIFLWRNNGNLFNAAQRDGLKNVQSGTQFLKLDALDGTDYHLTSIEDVDGLIHVGLIDRNHDVLETFKSILTEEEMSALL